MQLFLLISVLVLLPAWVYSQADRPTQAPEAAVYVVEPVQSKPSPKPISTPMSFHLSDHQWQHRVVLVFSPSEQSPAYQQQMQRWQADRQGVRDRDLKLVEVVGKVGRVDGKPITSASVARLWQEFGVKPDEFLVILVGKDGTEKQRSQVPIDLAALFQTIDAMPMRQQEMRDR
jgi:hypothetical protein